MKNIVPCVILRGDMKEPKISSVIDERELY